MYNGPPPKCQANGTFRAHLPHSSHHRFVSPSCPSPFLLHDFTSSWRWPRAATAATLRIPPLFLPPPTRPHPASSSVVVFESAFCFLFRFWLRYVQVDAAPRPSPPSPYPSFSSLCSATSVRSLWHFLLPLLPPLLLPPLPQQLPIASPSSPAPVPSCRCACRAPPLFSAHLFSSSPPLMGLTEDSESS